MFLHQVEAINDKLEKDPSDTLSPMLAAQQTKIDAQLQTMGKAIGKLVGKVDGMKSSEKKKNEKSKADELIDAIMGAKGKI